MGAPDATGTRRLSIHSRDADAGPEQAWVLNADGLLGPDDPSAQESGPALSPVPAAWPPPGAAPLPVDDVYERLSAAGFDYGTLFQGLRAAWQQDGRVYADVALPESAHGEARRFGLHPALLDAALHASAFLPLEAAASGRLPFCWRGVSLHASGAAAIRVELDLRSADSVALLVADRAGQPVVTIDSLTLREVTVGQFDFRLRRPARTCCSASTGRPAVRSRATGPRTRRWSSSPDPAESSSPLRSRTPARRWRPRTDSPLSRRAT